MRSSLLVRRGRIVASVVLVMAALVSTWAVELLPKVDSVREAGSTFLVLLVVGLGSAIAAAIACSERDHEEARWLTLKAAALIAAVPPVIMAIAGGGAVALLAFVLTAPLMMLLTVPTFGLVRAVLESAERPSLDAFDRVVAVACGFVVSVKVPEAAGAWMLGERSAAMIVAAFAAAGAIGFVVFQVRRRRRAARASDLLASSEELRLEPEAEDSDEAALLSGTPRLRVVRTSGSAGYRDGEQKQLVAIVPEAPMWPELKPDLERLGLGALLASFLAAVVVGLGLIARSC